MKQIIGVILSVLLVASSGVFFFLDRVETEFRRIFSGLHEPNTTDIQGIIEGIANEVFAPPPLKRLDQTTFALLDKANIILETNEERANEGLPLLKENSLLRAAAEKKLDDMIAKNYFAHVSPTGAGPDVWVKVASYEYILIGENLALGNFSDENDLVRAWMESPGHRANIMNHKFSDIGVAVRRGTIEGTTAHIAVQVFGMPTSVCPEPNTQLKKIIEEYEVELDTRLAGLDTLRKEAEAARSNDDKEAYNRLVREYNERVAEYNKTLEEVKRTVEAYNESVRAFNACALKT